MKKYLVALLTAMSACSAWADHAEKIMDVSGVKGGLIVVLGSDPEFLAGFGAAGGYIVQGLDADRDKVAVARETLRSEGLYGPITVKHWTEHHLPYADDVVNLIVIRDTEIRIRDGEIVRVLAPRGIAIGEEGPPIPYPGSRIENGFMKFANAVPPEIDDWTHYLHGPNNNAVAKDSVVGPPRHLKWTGGPKYSRNHEIDSSVVAAVSAQGRFLYVVDEGLPGFMGKYLPQTWALVARDAFSGVILWKRPMPGMGWPQWKPVMADADWTKLVAQRRLIPITLPRRVVADGDLVFAALGYHEPLTILDAATGETLRTVDGTTGTDEVLFHDNKLILSVRPHSRGNLDKKEDTLAVINRNDKLVTNHPGIVMAVDPDSGKILWQSPSDRLLPLSLTAARDKVFFHTGAEIACVNSSTGQRLWDTPNLNAKSFRWNVDHTLVAHEDVLLVGTPSKLEAFSTETGELLWEGKGGRKGFAGSNPVNLYVIDGLVWSPAGARAGSIAEGRDLRTGEVKRTIELPQYMYTAGHHFRCYRGKATERYLLENKRGIEMIDLEGDNFVKNDWVRGICRYGIMPSNGMIYSTPTPCSCYPAALLTGFNALAAGESRTTSREPRAGKESSPLHRFEQGPAYGEPESSAPKSTASSRQPSADWACFRNNSLRSGVSPVTVGTKVKQRWRAKLRGKLTQPVVADGQLFVASVDEQTVHALNAETGKELWSCTVDGRVDSPPTFCRGRLFFGSRNGWVYSLRASDGVLVWRYRVAPGDEQIVSYNQLESVWPARGSALVVDDVVYAAAGRNSYLDRGIFVVGLEAETGRRLYSAHLKNDPQDPATGKGEAHVIDGFKLDVLTSDGTFVYMQGAAFDKTLKGVLDEAKQTPSIYATAGLLDDLAWNRNAWRVGMNADSLRLNKKNLAGMSHTGQILLFDAKLVYGVKYFLGHSGQSAVFYPGQDGYKLFAHRVDAIGGGKPSQSPKKKRGRAKPSSSPVAWECMISVRVRAMTKADKILFIAGAPDVFDDEDPLAALEGRKGAILKAYAAGDGEELTEMKLDSPPVFDGLIAANGKLFMSNVEGSVICMGE